MALAPFSQPLSTLLILTAAPSPKSGLSAKMDVSERHYGMLLQLLSQSLTADALMARFHELEKRIAAVLAAGMDPTEARRKLEAVERELKCLKARLEEAKRRRG